MKTSTLFNLAVVLAATLAGAFPVSDPQDELAQDIPIIAQYLGGASSSSGDDLEKRLGIPGPRVPKVDEGTSSGSGNSGARADRQANPNGALQTVVGRGLVASMVVGGIVLMTLV